MKSDSDVQATISHVAIQTAHFEQAFDFYTGLLGLKVVKAPFDFKGKRTLAWLDAISITIELYSIKKGEEAQPYDGHRVGADHIAFQVQNLDTILEHLKRHDIRILKEPFLPPTDDPRQLRIAFIEGVDGEEIELVETTK